MSDCILGCRDAGGAFGKRQATKEEEYFRQLVKSPLSCLTLNSLLWTYLISPHFALKLWPLLWSSTLIECCGFLFVRRTKLSLKL